tara:strand:+ start:495 stop:1073 length:579 start_codon:yes stop_codon:yes gene_type:complete
MTIFFMLTLGLIGCGESAPKETPPKETPQKAEPPQEASKKEAAKPEAKPQPQKTEASAVVEKKGFNPLDGKTLKEICEADGLLLIKWPYAKIQSEFSALCCTKDGLSSDDYRCEMDWPFSDVPSCSAYDEMRNEIFARYGRAFKTPKWQKTFGATNWYKIRSDFSNDWLSDVATKNIALLVQNKTNKVACMD